MDPTAPHDPSKPEPQPVVAAIVTSELGVLVGRRNDGKPPRTFIAGEIEPGDSPADAGIREVKEETQTVLQRRLPFAGQHKEDASRCPDATRMVGGQPSAILHLPGNQGRWRQRTHQEAASTSPMACRAYFASAGLVSLKYRK
jgi:8-oxo-dGTP pyrophosphatase MutT (NUDIX family)